MGKEGGMGMALMLGWVVTTVGFVLATAFWRGELFGGKSVQFRHRHRARKSSEIQAVLSGQV